MTFGALLHPLFLARAVASCLVFFVLARASGVALFALRGASEPAGSEAATRTARDVERVCATVELALFASLFGTVALVLAADKISPLLEGAMCAYGVFEATPWGFFAFFSSLFLSFASAAWLALHRLDLALLSPTFTIEKLTGAIVLVVLAGIDLVAHVAFSTTIDLATTVSCCSSSFDAMIAQASQESGSALRDAAVSTSLVFVSATLLVSLGGVRKISRTSLALSGLTGVAASVCTAFAIVLYVAPYIYQTPTHACPFCLLGEMGHFLGWPIFMLWWCASACALAFVVLANYARGDQANEKARELAKPIVLASAVCWILLALTTAWPVLRFSLETGGLSLFGSRS